jgi:hypothetical protein
MKKVYKPVTKAYANFCIDLPPERIKHPKSSGQATVNVVLGVFLGLLLLLLRHSNLDPDDDALLNLPSFQEVSHFFATSVADGIPRLVAKLVSSLMLFYVGICLGYAGVLLYLEL